MPHTTPQSVLELDERCRIETLLADLAAEFVHLRADQVDDAIRDALRRLVVTLGVDRSSLSELTGSSDDLVTTHSWAHPDFPMTLTGVSLTRPSRRRARWRSSSIDGNLGAAVADAAIAPVVPAGYERIPLAVQAEDTPVEGGGTAAPASRP